ncbi:MAG: family 43 glycosylhydrolase [Verrucomicrobiales bacterium]|nr:family 43 glycosylhydrolase [Verrucomicrobiales bacterium]
MRSPFRTELLRLGRGFGLTFALLGLPLFGLVAAAEGASEVATKASLPSRLPVWPEAGELTGLRKLADIPLRDPSICRGSDGAWYLTGTSEPFWSFNNENGIRVWRTRDFATWEPLGTVWRYGGSPWHQPYFEKRKPIWAPEIHHLKGTFWLTYSLPGWDGTGRTSGCGLLRSTSGKPEGPYEDVQPGAPMGDEIDASLFEDDDGTVYFLWHSGKIARMKPDLSGLVEEPYRWLRTTTSDPDPKHHSGLCEGIFGKGSFDHVGYEGMYLFKTGGLYHLSCAEGFDGRYSCMVVSSPNLFGPYRERYEAIPHGGHNVFFQDELGGWWSTIFNGPISERPAIVPVRIKEGRITLLPASHPYARSTRTDAN